MLAADKTRFFTPTTSRSNVPMLSRRLAVRLIGALLASLFFELSFFALDCCKNVHGHSTWNLSQARTRNQMYRRR